MYIGTENAKTSKLVFSKNSSEIQVKIEVLVAVVCFFWSPGRKITVQLTNMKHLQICDEIPFYNTATFTDNPDHISYSQVNHHYT